MEVIEGGMNARKIRNALLAIGVGASTVMAPNKLTVDESPSTMADRVFPDGISKVIIDKIIKGVEPNATHVEDEMTKWAKDSARHWVSSPWTPNQYSYAQPLESVSDESPSLQSFVIGSTIYEIRATLKELKAEWDASDTLKSKFTDVGKYLISRYNEFKETKNDIGRFAIEEYIDQRVKQYDPKKNLEKFQEFSAHDVNEPTPQFKNTLTKYKDAVVVGMKLGRTKVKFDVTPFTKELPYDKLYHLFIIIETSNGPLRLDKNHALNLDIVTGDYTSQTSEWLDITDDVVRSTPFMTIGELFDTT